MKNFITNDNEQQLQKRLETLIAHSDTLKFLVGFFYFSGWQALIDSLRDNPHAELKILVGLSVDKVVSQSHYTHQTLTAELPIDGSREDNDSRFSHFMHSLKTAINHPDRDTQVFYEQVGFFVQCLQNGRLHLRKTLRPNHAKLYLFCLQESGKNIINQNGCFITGSSNLTQAGLARQQEFNVEIKDYGFDTAEEYFDALWTEALPISEDDEYKQRLLDFFDKESFFAHVTPYQAYALVLKTYLDLQNAKKIDPKIERLLEKNGFEKYQYQLDAVGQAAGIVDAYGGVIIADVVGLGKSVIASMLGAQFGQRGLLICPPGLMGDAIQKDSGWHEYCDKFGLHDWSVVSCGKIQELAESDRHHDYDMVVVDEAHRFRNEATKDYAALSTICRHKKVVLLTATPFNNTPDDIYALLKLFLLPSASGITLDGNLDGQFARFRAEFKALSALLRRMDSTDPNQLEKCRKDYQKRFGKGEPDRKKVDKAMQSLSANIKKVIEPVIIRRNRLDLLNDEEYRQEIGALSTVKDPQERFYQLGDTQSAFYDQLISDYFAKDNSRFKGAIYTPLRYREGLQKQDYTLDEHRSMQSQSNLFDFMRRLLVKRFESSFGAFAETIERFEKVHKMALELVRQSGRYILDRSIMEKFYSEDNQSFQEVEKLFLAFQEKTETATQPKHDEVYIVDDFDEKEQFIADIQSDLQLLSEIKAEIAQLKLVEDDPKTAAVMERIEQVLGEKNTEKNTEKDSGKNSDPKRKIILFSEYTDTVKYLEKSLSEHPIAERVLFCYENISQTNRQQLLENFDARHEVQRDDYDVLIATDKLSEGFNFNRAGLIINYDIPWNPTRVIQRVGRINRMSAKVFDELWIDNFFPSERGADVVRSREIAAHKMALIHHALGEDAKMFDDEEAPQASAMFEKINRFSDVDEETESLSTFIRNEYRKVDDATKERIENLPARVKTAKIADADADKGVQAGNALVLQKKGLALFALAQSYAENGVADDNVADTAVLHLSLMDFIYQIKCDKETPVQKLSNGFWSSYEKILAYQKSAARKGSGGQSAENKAHNRLKSLLQEHKRKQVKLDTHLIGFVKTLLKDIRDYKTLPDYHLRELGEEKADKLINHITALRRRWGDGYLNLMIERSQQIDKDIVVGVDNQ